MAFACYIDVCMVSTIELI